MAVVAHDVSSIRWFEDIGIENIPLVGGKNASLGEMYRELASQGVRYRTALPLPQTPIESFSGG